MTIARWDPFNAVIVSQYAGTLKFNDVQKDQTYRAEVDETTGLEEKIITDSKNKAMADYLGLNIDETMAFGDGGNDISIIKEQNVIAVLICLIKSL